MTCEPPSLPHLSLFLCTRRHRRVSALTLSWLLSVQVKKNSMKDASQKSLNVLSKLSSWCLQDLGTALNRKKIETLVTIQVHQRDVSNDLFGLFKARALCYYRCRFVCVRARVCVCVCACVRACVTRCTGVCSLQAKKIQTADDFEWLKQVRA